jgi:glycosyltransferase involved in cell wall biosynthesis
MNFLFVHNNFPAQFRHVARALASEPGNRVEAIGWQTARAIPDVKLTKYSLPSGDVRATHPFARRFDLECRRAEQVMYALTSLQARGFTPETIMVHPGWGENLPIRGIYPNARLIVYCEYYYGIEGRDVGFDPEFPEFGRDGHVAVHLKNAATLLALADCDGGVSPTAWQRDTYPEVFRDKIAVVHEGVDVDQVAPDADAFYRLPSGRVLTRADEVVTFVGRNLEPLRGLHVFMRALPRILEKRPDAHVLVVGRERNTYGASAPAGKTWKSVFLDEVRDRIDPQRVHFTGLLSYADYLRVLQVSSAHVYLTYPFVLSWSLIEALSAGCLVIGSDTAPVREVIDGRNGILVPFFDVEALVGRVVEALAHQQRFTELRAQARRTVLERFDLKRLCLPAYLNFLRGERPQLPKTAPSRIARRQRAKDKPAVNAAPGP